ncbi:MAG: phosphoribosylformylglycinamidine synthase subunit PurQ, partial [Thermoplasmata archaeon]|nr:phosphoribosylformylglycinamidine synthase subunit PurQ [Thermoplasmata archaeon]
MKGKVKVCVMYGDGINCDNETLEAFRLAGAEPRKA